MSSSSCSLSSSGDCSGGGSIVMQLIRPRYSSLSGEKTNQPRPVEDNFFWGDFQKSSSKKRCDSFPHPSQSNVDLDCWSRRWFCPSAHSATHLALALAR
ncbi:hypothetical protein VTO42DRAFT_1455 [Malbranchea cinnamomea]